LLLEWLGFEVLQLFEVVEHSLAVNLAVFIRTDCVLDAAHDVLDGGGLLVRGEGRGRMRRLESGGRGGLLFQDAFGRLFGWGGVPHC